VSAVRIAALVKQIPAFEAMELGPDGRLVREGLELEMNAYCRRAVSKGTELAQQTGGTCTILTLGPPSAEDVLREGVAWGADDAVLISDPAFAGSDTLATARALAAALEREGPFDLVLVGRNSVDADTGQVGPEAAQLLDHPFLTGVRELELRDDHVWARCERDDEWVTATVRLPAFLSVAERLCEPCKMPPEARAEVPADRIRRLTAADLGPGPWGQEGSPTTVGDVRVLEADRLNLALGGSVEEQVTKALDVLADRGALDRWATGEAQPVPVPGEGNDLVTVLVEPDRDRLTRELVGEAAALAAEIGGRVVCLGPAPPPDDALSSWGADEVVAVDGALVEEDVAGAVTAWAEERMPWAVLAPGTAWGREVASRVAAAIGAGLTGDAVDLGVEDGRLVAFKPAFGGRLVAAIRADSLTQMATVRPGVLSLREPRPSAPVERHQVAVEPRGRVIVSERSREDDVETLAKAEVVVGVGMGIQPDEYEGLRSLLHVLGAELAATRKVTDKGWMPRARQVGITGHSISPRLFVSLGASGKFNHMVGVRGAGTVLAVNNDADCFVHEFADVSIVADWHDVVPELVAQLEARGYPRT